MAKSWQPSRRGAAKCLHIFMAEEPRVVTLMSRVQAKLNGLSVVKLMGFPVRSGGRRHVHAHTTVWARLVSRTFVSVLCSIYRRYMLWDWTTTQRLRQDEIFRHSETLNLTHFVVTSSDTSTWLVSHWGRSCSLTSLQLRVCNAVLLSLPVMNSEVWHYPVHWVYQEC